MLLLKCISLCNEEASIVDENLHKNFGIYLLTFISRSFCRLDATSEGLNCFRFNSFIMVPEKSISSEDLGSSSFDPVFHEDLFLHDHWTHPFCTFMIVDECQFFKMVC